MSQQLMNMIHSLDERLEKIEELLSHPFFQAKANGSESNVPLEMRIQTLENKYMAMNARMGKRD